MLLRTSCFYPEGLIILWTTVSAVLVSAVCVAVFKLATPYPTTVVGPNGETWLEDITASSESAAAVGTPAAKGGDAVGRRGEGGGGSGNGGGGDSEGVVRRLRRGGYRDEAGEEEEEDGEEAGHGRRGEVRVEKGRERRRGRGSAGSSLTPSSTRGGSKGDDDRQLVSKVSSTLAGRGAGGKSKLESKASGMKSRGEKGKISGRAAKAPKPKLGNQGEAEAGCAPKSFEKVHGVYRQFQPACAGTAGGNTDHNLGCVAGTQCQKCYVSGTPAETQSGSMGWCRASVCAEFAVAGCKGEKKISQSKLGTFFRPWHSGSGGGGGERGTYSYVNEGGSRDRDGGGHNAQRRREPRSGSEGASSLDDERQLSTLRPIGGIRGGSGGWGGKPKP